jgi:glycosyltransferase involved in cell wall biosynthesis
VAEGGPCDTVMDGVNGYLTEATPAALGTAIARLFANPARLTMMGQAGARYVSTHYSWEAGAHTLLRVLDTVERKLR